MIVNGIRSGIQPGLRSGIDPFFSAMAPVALTDGSSGTDGTGFTTASVTPVAGVPYFLGIANTHGTAAEVPSSVVGNTITWTAVASGTGATAAGVRRVTWFYGYSTAPTAGTIVITTAGTMTSCAWGLVGVPGAALADAVQATTATGNSTTLTGTLAQLLSTSNIHLYAVSHAAAEATAIPTTGGWTSLASRTVTTPNGGLGIAWAIGQKTGAPTWATSSSAVMVDLEIAAG